MSLLERGTIGIKEVVNLMFRRSRRTREEIVYEILRVLKVTHGAHISYVMQKARLNYYQAKNYLNELTMKEYIAVKNGLYICLEQGREFITRYEALKILNKT